MTIEDQPWIGVLVGVLAMVPFTIQAIIFLRNRHRQRTWVRATAIVLRTRTTSRSDNAVGYEASYSYTDTHGRARSGSSEIDHDAPNGERLPIVFDPEDPARSQPWRRVGIGHWIAGGFGLLFFAVGIFGVVQSIHLMRTGEML